MVDFLNISFSIDVALLFCYGHDEEGQTVDARGQIVRWSVINHISIPLLLCDTLFIKAFHSSEDSILTCNKGTLPMEKSLSQLLSDAAIINRIYPPVPGVCHAVICLNISGKPAKADEHIVSLGYCKCRTFMNLDGERVCAACWTPQKTLPSTVVDEQTVSRVKTITDRMSTQDLTTLATILNENRDIHTSSSYDQIKPLLVDNELPHSVKESIIALTGERLLSEEIPSPVMKLRQHVQEQGWSILSEKEIPSGIQIRVSNGSTVVSASCYENGTIFVQGGNNSLKKHLQEWSTQFSSKDRG